MKVFFKNNCVYILLYIAILAYLGVILLNHGKVQIHQYINAYVGNAFVDVFFKYITNLGDGLFAVIVVIIMLFFNVKKALYILLSYLSASLVATILKAYVYTQHWRPAFVFQYFVNKPLHVVEGVFLNTGNNTLPSGHATAAFAVFISLVFISKNHVLKSLFFLLAILATYSRTHLSQHWLIDIYIGSIIGFSFALLCYTLFYNKTSYSKLDTSLKALLSKKNKHV